MWKRGAALLTALLMLFSCALAEDVYLDEPTPGAAEETADDTLTARADLINRIIALGQELYIKANGKSQRAHYKRDIYVCKNFTTYLFRQNRDDFCMAEYPGRSAARAEQSVRGKEQAVQLWHRVGGHFAGEGESVLHCGAVQVRQKSVRGGKYGAGVRLHAAGAARRLLSNVREVRVRHGAHSAIMLGYDPETDEIHWMDSNMRGGKKKGIRYGLVQFDEVKSVAWWASTFCKKTRGATLYRLRDDIVYRPGHEPENTTGE